MITVSKINDIQCFSLDVTSSSPMSTIVFLQEQHRLVLDKLLPEIDLHFYLVFQNSRLEICDILRLIYEDFQEFSLLLTDHMVMEEELIFPKMKRNESLESAALIFINKHDDFECRIQNVLQDLNERLNEVSDYMSFRMLQNKLNVLKNILEEHQELEDELLDKVFLAKIPTTN